MPRNHVNSADRSSELKRLVERMGDEIVQGTCGKIKQPGWRLGFLQSGAVQPCLVSALDAHYTPDTPFGQPLACAAHLLSKEEAEIRRQPHPLGRSKLIQFRGRGAAVRNG